MGKLTFTALHSLGDKTVLESGSILVSKKLRDYYE